MSHTITKHKEHTAHPETVFQTTLIKAETDVQAQNQIGWYYEQGIGIKSDKKQARKWYEKAAKQGLSDAQYNLGRCYEKAIGSWLSDAKNATKYYQLAADQNHTEALFNLGRCKQFGIGTPFSECISPLEEYTVAAKQGHSQAQYELGLYYEQGNFENVNWEKSISSYQQAALQGHIQARQSLEIIAKRYEQGDGVSKDINRAKALFNLLQYIKGQNEADKLFDKGSAYEKKNEFGYALEFYSVASSRGHIEAQEKFKSLMLLKDEQKKELRKKPLTGWASEPMAGEETIQTLTMFFGAKLNGQERELSDIQIKPEDSAVEDNTNSTNMNEPLVNRNGGIQ